MNSEKYKFNKNDGLKILKGLGIAIAGSALAYAAQLLPLIDWQGNEYLIIPIAAVLINTGRKFLSKQ